MSIKESFTSFWDRVTGKTLYEVSQTVKQLEERMNMLQLDLDAANIKLASTEIDLEASNIEKEILKSELEEKKAEIARLNLTISNLKEQQAEQARQSSLISSVELEALTRKLAEEEYLGAEYKNRLAQIVNMLTAMSKEEKYSDIIRIQTNSIDETGKETRQVYMNYGDITVEVDESVTTAQATATTATAGFGGQIISGVVAATPSAAAKGIIEASAQASEVVATTPSEASKAIVTAVAGNAAATTNESTWLNGDEAIERMYAHINELAEVELALTEESVNDIADELMAN